MWDFFGDCFIFGQGWSQDFADLQSKYREKNCGALRDRVERTIDKIIFDYNLIFNK